MEQAVVAMRCELNVNNVQSFWSSNGPCHDSGRQVPASYRKGPGLDPESVHVRRAVDKMALGNIFLQVLRFCLVNITSPVLHTHFHLHDACSRRTNGRRSLDTFQKAIIFRKLRSTGHKGTFTLLHSLATTVTK